MQKLLQDVGIGGNLRSLRKARGLTQKALCELMTAQGRPMSQSTYAQIETGVRNIFISDLIALKTILNAEYDDLFSGLTPINKYEQGE